MSKKTLFLGLLLGTAFWGVSYPVTKAGVGYADPYSFQTYKFAAAALAVAGLFPRQLARLSWRTVGWGLLLAGPLFAGSTLLAIGLQTTSAANAAFLTGLSVLLVPLRLEKSAPILMVSLCAHDSGAVPSLRTSGKAASRTQYAAQHRARDQIGNISAGAGPWPKTRPRPSACGWHYWVITL